MTCMQEIWLIQNKSMIHYAFFCCLIISMPIAVIRGLTLFLPDLVTWRSYMGWFRPWPVGIGLKTYFLVIRHHFRSFMFPTFMVATILILTFHPYFILFSSHCCCIRSNLWIKSLNGTFLALQIKAFGQKKIQISCKG